MKKHDLNIKTKTKNLEINKRKKNEYLSLSLFTQVFCNFLFSNLPRRAFLPLPVATTVAGIIRSPVPATCSALATTTFPTLAGAPPR